MRSSMQPRQGYTLIELLVVMGIIMLMITLVLLSVSSMLRSSKMSRGVSLIVAAADEARTAAITIRRSTKVDLTRMDPEGRFNRLTVVGPFFNENFESYVDAAPDPVKVTPDDNGWLTSGAFYPNASLTPLPSLASDGSRCLRMAAGQQYWNVTNRIDTVKQDDFECTVFARVKLLPTTNRTAARSVSVLGAVKDSGANVTSAYQVTLTINPSVAPSFPGRNLSSNILLDRMGGGALVPVGPLAVDKVDLDIAGAPAKTTELVEGVWYRVNLSVKLITEPVTNVSYAIVAAKVWADGQLEPWAWTCGPLRDNNPLSNGTGGFAVAGPAGADALVDDVLFDIRPIRVLPAGIRIDAMRVKPPLLDSFVETDWEVAPEDSPYFFPILFRPDGTSSQKYIVRLTDLTSADKRYVTIDMNTGRARLEHSLKDAVKQ